MLHVDPSTAAVSAELASDPEIEKAKRWIAGARECGLVVFPWYSISATGARDRGGVMQFGQDTDGPNNFSAATDRFRKHPAVDAVDGCREGVVFDALCAEFGVSISDPDFCDKVNAIMRRQYADRRQTQGDRHLISLCRKAQRILRNDEELWTRSSAIEDAYEDARPPRPTVPGTTTLEQNSTKMRDHLREAKKVNTREALEPYLV